MKSVKINGKVTDEFNPYKEVRNRFGKEDKESNIPSVNGAVAIREWKNGIIVVRRAEYDHRRGMFVLKDEVTIPKRDEFLELIKVLE